MYRVGVSELRVPAKVGTSANERAFPQMLKVTIECELDRYEALTTDSLEATVNYLDVLQTVEGISKRREWQLIETYAFDIMSELFQHFPAIRTTRCLIKKGNVVAQAESVMVELAFDRDAFEGLRRMGRSHS